MIRDQMHCSIDGLEVLSAMAVIIPLVSLVAVWYFPSLESVEDYKHAEDLAENGKETLVVKEEAQVRSAGVWCALFFICCRAFSVSALEAGTAMLLEVEFKWDKKHAIGVAIGFCFLCSGLMNLLLKTCKAHISLSLRLRAMMGLSALGAFMMMPVACFLRYADCSWVLLAADCVLFSCLQVSDGMIQGIMYNHALPNGFFLDVSNVAVLALIFCDGVGRTLGPPVARWNIDRGGQWEYALWQLAICSAAILLMEFILYLNSKIKEAPPPAPPAG